MQTIQVDLAIDTRPGIEPRPTAKAKAPQPEPKLENKVDSQELAKLEKTLAQHNISLKFSRDEATNHIVVQLIDQNGEAIRQFPTKVSLSLAATFQKLQGVFLDVTK